MKVLNREHRIRAKNLCFNTKILKANTDERQLLLCIIMGWTNSIHNEQDLCAPETLRLRERQLPLRLDLNYCNIFFIISDRRRNEHAHENNGGKSA